MRNLYLLLVASAFLGLWSCQGNTNPIELPQIEDPDVRRVLFRSFEAWGGWETFKSVDAIEYRKRNVLYHSDGGVESDITQHHKYSLAPNLEGTIEWSDSIGDHKIIYTSSEATRLINGETIADGSQSAKSSFLSAHYVLFMPFKIPDPGVELSYLGVDTVNAQEVEVIKATYKPSEFDNHSTQDTWYFYFDSRGDFVANMVYHEPTYALIENNEVNTDSPLKLHSYRKSWRTDSLGNKQYLRGEFWYDNYKLTLR